VCLLSPASTALADWEARLVARTDPSEPFRAGPIQARLGETAEVIVALVDGRGRVYADADAVALRRRARAPRGPLPEGVVIHWIRVEPRMYHIELDPPNEGNASYSNSVLFGPDHGDWLGFDTLEYDARTLSSSPGIAVESERVSVRAARPTSSHFDRHGDAGSIWLAAEVLLPDGTVVPTASAGDVDRYGLSQNVMRVSFRASDDYIGWLSTYFNVPNVFGSAGSGGRHQSDRYVGADCADVLVGALRASGANVEYTSVSGMRHLADAATDVFVIGEDGIARDQEGAELRLEWGVDVLPGDLLAINYDRYGDALPRSWDHIGALLGDGGSTPNGFLDATDLLRHMGSRVGLVDMPISSQGAITARIWRWDD
jgi:hypothetical protein